MQSVLLQCYLTAHTVTTVQGIWHQIRGEFMFVNFLFPVEKIDLFNRCQWPIPVNIFLSYKVVLALFTTVITIGAPIYAGLRYFVYLTNISYTITAIYFLSSAIRTVTFEVLRRKRNNRRSEVIFNGNIDPSSLRKQNIIHALLKFSIYFEWMARHLAYCGALIVTVGFYSFVASLQGMSGRTLFDVNFHIMNSVIVLVDLFISASPVKLFHGVWVVVYGIAYGVFTYIYYLLYDEVLYRVLSDWSDPHTAARYFALFVFIGSLLSNLFIYLLYLLRVMLYVNLRRYLLSRSEERTGLYVVNP
ncbi:hypothetical protein HELRODRAFT_177871 [Helobdella robusta]|uniref:Uncharacterized protein n=1 Tax=Helobdella robusta TaxID=6412 RepID=T1FCE4_HELRO|nr:hypothetical protein HELRODRAFT_177871 [Helobdella robusta]ESN97806.1 hypothetical protein HELRODRAFT_177871 [Helobdella robusta]